MTGIARHSSASAPDRRRHTAQRSGRMSSTAETPSIEQKGSCRCSQEPPWRISRECSEFKSWTPRFAPRPAESMAFRASTLQLTGQQWTKDPNYRILAHQRGRFTHYYFYIRDEVLGPMVMRVASFFPFQTTYYLNGHSFIEQELNRAQVGFRKHDNAFLAVSDPQALQAAADRFTSQVIRKRLDYWTLILGPKFSKRERA